MIENAQSLSHCALISPHASINTSLTSNMQISSLRGRDPPTAAPPGTRIDYNSLDSIGNDLVVPSFVTFFAALLGVVGRICAKRFVSHVKLEKDDWFSITALLFAVGRLACNCWEVWTAGVGRHVWDIRLTYIHSILNVRRSTSVPSELLDNTDRLQVYEIGNILYLFGVMFAKLSILALYINLFGLANIKFRWACQMVGFIAVGYCVGCALSFLFPCTPVAKVWDRNIPGNCGVDLVTLDITVGALNLLTDIVIFVLPLPILVRLHTSTKRRLGLLVIFSTGLM